MRFQIDITSTLVKSLSIIIFLSFLFTLLLTHTKSQSSASDIVFSVPTVKIWNPAQFYLEIDVETLVGIQDIEAFVTYPSSLVSFIQIPDKSTALSLGCRDTGINATSTTEGQIHLFRTSQNTIIAPDAGNKCLVLLEFQMKNGIPLNTKTATFSFVKTDTWNVTSSTNQVRISFQNNQKDVALPLCQMNWEGDSNCDTSVDLLDFELFRNDFIAYRSKVLPLSFTHDTDFVRDTRIDLEDFNVFRESFRKYRSELISGSCSYKEIQCNALSCTAKLYCQIEPTPTQSITTTTPIPSTKPGGISGLRVNGNQIVNAAGEKVRMVGVNFSGAEYTCINNEGNWDVPATQATINAMKTWKIKAVRITLNEDCWLGINGISTSFAGAHKKAVIDFTNLLVTNNIVPIINLHFSGDGVKAVKEQEPMANRKNSINFWSSVASAFKDNTSIIFEPFNEAHLNDVSITNGTAWPCWRDGGCSVKGTNSGEGVFEVAGMQEMVSAIRSSGAKNIIIITGLNWGSDVSKWEEYKPSDPLNQLVVGWHTYGDGLSCGDENCWNSVLAPLVQKYPLIATEIGQLPPQKGCAHDYIDKVMSWLDAHGGQGYLAWTWGPFSCSNDPALITNYDGSPSQTYGQGFKDHLISLD